MSMGMLQGIFKARRKHRELLKKTRKLNTEYGHYWLVCLAYKLFKIFGSSKFTREDVIKYGKINPKTAAMVLDRLRTTGYIEYAGTNPEDRRRKYFRFKNGDTNKT